MGLHYFISDVHLGLDYMNPVAREERFAKFLEDLPPQTEQLFLLGDIFDFWYEYKSVIPRRFTRTLGALAHLSDRGVKIIFLNGNHDIWTYSYFQKEVGVTFRHQPWIEEINGVRFCLGHGDGLWDKNLSYRILRSVFKCRFLQILFSAVHPRWAFLFGHTWSKHNRLTRYKGENDNSLLEYKEKLKKNATKWASDFQKNLEEKGQRKIDHFIFGHYHNPIKENVVEGGDLTILGDWIHHPDYLVFDGTNLEERKLEAL